jgi:hypothetical protein
MRKSVTKRRTVMVMWKILSRFRGVAIDDGWIGERI